MLPRDVITRAIFPTPQNQLTLCNTYPVDPRVPLGAGDFRPGCSEADVRTAVAVDLNVGGLLAGERVPGRGPAGTKEKDIRMFSSRI